MKRKELKALAQKIAKVELQIREATDSQEKHKLQGEMMKLCSKVNNLEDIAIIDEMVLEILEKI